MLKGFQFVKSPFHLWWPELKKMTSRPKKNRFVEQKGLETPSIHLGNDDDLQHFQHSKNHWKSGHVYIPLKKASSPKPPPPLAGEVLKSWEESVELQLFPLLHHFFGVPLKINLGDDYTPQGGNMSPQIHGPFLSKAKDRLPKTHVPVPLFFRRHVSFRGTRMSFS